MLRKVVRRLLLYVVDTPNTQVVRFSLETKKYFPDIVDVVLNYIFLAAVWGLDRVKITASKHEHPHSSTYEYRGSRLRGGPAKSLSVDDDSLSHNLF